MTTTRPLTPESKALLRLLEPSLDDTSDAAAWEWSRQDEYRDRLAAIEAAAIARYVEGLGTQVSHRLHEWGRGPGCNGRNVTMVVCEGCQTFAARLLALDAPEAQEADR